MTIYMYSSQNYFEIQKAYLKQFSHLKISLKKKPTANRKRRRPDVVNMIISSHAASLLGDVWKLVANLGRANLHDNCVKQHSHPNNRLWLRASKITEKDFKYRSIVEICQKQVKVQYVISN